MSSTKTTQKPLRWGIVGCGNISKDFVLAFDYGKHPHEVVAVATASSLDKAQNFAKDLHLPDTTKAYGSYSQLLNDPNVDIVYIGNLNDAHCKCTLDALDKGKHVLCEKALAVNAKQVKQMVAKAREKNLFLMEALWARFFPGWQYIKKTTQSKELGEVKVAHANFGIHLPHSRHHPETGETPLYDIGVYVVNFNLFVFDNQKPKAIHVVGEKDANGSDTWANITLDYGNGVHGTCYFNGSLQLPNSGYVAFEKGIIQFPEWFWCPTKLLQADSPFKADVTEHKVLNFPLNEKKSGSSIEGDFVHNHSAGLCYEADHVYECLQQGKRESDVMGLEHSITFAEVLEEIRHKLGVVFKQDSE